MGNSSCEGNIKSETIKARLAALRARMREEGVTLYMVSCSDFHMTESPASYFNTLEYISGFTGSNGMMVITENNAHLWTDGRYTLQAADELRGTGIILHISSDEEDEIRTLPMFFGASGDAFFDAMIDDGIEHSTFDPQKFKTVIGCDGRTFPFYIIDEIVDNLGIAFDTGAVVINAKLDLIGDIWHDRPDLPHEQIELLGNDLTGIDAAEKIEMLRLAIGDIAPDTGCVLTSLDDICWLYNIRGRDIEYSLLTLCYAYVNQDEALLFIDDRKLTGMDRENLQSSDITMMGYDEFYGFLEEVEDHFIIMDPNKNNAAVVITIGEKQDCSMITYEGIVDSLKCIKNPVERTNSINTHIKDAIAVIQFIKWIKENAGREAVTEYTAGTTLYTFRKMQGAICSSFETICAYGPHAAIVHYSANSENSAKIEASGLLLVDSGGHYYGGTTDITRTIPLGELTDDMKRDYTIALSGMLELSNVVFPQGVKDNQLDMIARYPMWKHGIDYDHGTGHGVGAMLSVHEGPQSISWRKSREGYEMESGMITTCEPGIYRAGKYGIRHENELLCVEDKDHEGYLKFVPITFVPIDTAPIDKDYLSTDQIKMLNDYNAYVYNIIAGYLDEVHREWLRSETLPI